MTPEELNMIKDLLGREPNHTELGLFTVMWSEHCSYKNSKPLLKKFPTTGKRVLQGPGEGAGIVDIGDGQGVAFKMESHNYPSAVEPFHGAATGVGGILRDVFSMGARPVAVLSSLRFGELDNDRVKFLFKEIARGIAAYSNGTNIPGVGGEIYFDKCYAGNPLVNAMCVGIINHEDIMKGQAHGVGNTVMYAGAATGRDGIHGAAHASEELSDDSENESRRASVPAGNPELEKFLIDACLEVVKSPALVGIQDMGAAGLISSSSEMASKAGMGIEMVLDRVPQSEPDMTAYEMMLSESQERMLMVVKKGQEQEIIDIFKKYGLDAVDVGHVTDDKMVRIIHKGKVEAEVPADALVSEAPVYHRPSKEPKRDLTPATLKPISDYNKTLLDLLGQPTIASKEWVSKQCTVEGSMLIPPGSDSAIIKVECGKGNSSNKDSNKDSNKALAMTADCNSRYVYLDPYTGGKIAVAESARNIVASGATPIAITDCLNYGSPENPEIFWQMEQSIDGISEACRVFDTPVISGNVSLYNERSTGGTEKSTAIYPTPTIGMVGLIDDLSHITTQFFKNPGDIIYLIGETKQEYGGSEIQKLQYGRYYGMPPFIDLTTEKANQDTVLAAIKAGDIKSAHDISEGGLAVALAECLMSDTTDASLGAELENINPDDLFSESQSRFIVTAAPGTKINGTQIGQVTNTGRLVINTNTINLAVKELEERWRGAIPCLLK